MDEVAKINNVSVVSPYKNVNAGVSRNTVTTSSASIIATNSSYLEVTNTKLAKGRKLSVIDIENKSKVCILGSSISSTLFNLAEPIGETIQIDGDNYTVIGVLETKGTSMGTNYDNLVLIPFSTAEYLGADTSINSLYAKVENETNIDLTKSLIENYIRSTLQISTDYYTVSKQGSMLEAMEEISGTLSLLLRRNSRNFTCSRWNRSYECNVSFSSRKN